MQHRYQLLVKQHVRLARRTATGLRVNTKDRRVGHQKATFGRAPAAAQTPPKPPRTPQQKARKAAEVAAQRFYDNDALTLPQLGAPLLQQTKTAVRVSCRRYALCVHDQSPLHYTHHAAKADRIPMYGKDDLGYLLTAALVLSDRDGAPLGVPYLALEAADGVHTTRRATPLPARPWVDEINRTMNYLQAQDFAALLVHLTDRELDKLLQLRRIARCRHPFVIRANDQRRLQHEGQSKLIKDAVESIRPQLQYARDVSYHGKKAYQYVGETLVTLDQPARRVRQQADGTTRHQKLPGASLTLRLVVAEVRAKDGKVLATWLLWTNLPATDVDAATIALWYYWRWRIEKFHQLLKSNGQALEQWQQETVTRVARRLLVAAQACAIAWAIAQDETDEGAALRELLMRLSGQQVPRAGADLTPILLAGTWNLLAMIDALDDYSVGAIREQGSRLYSMLGLALPAQGVNEK